jgi:FHS family L-fucose permease-like MFS transporter
MVVSQSGHLAVAALCLMFFFMSVMYPIIFSSALRDLGDKTKIGSSLLTMAVSGGAVYPLAMGYNCGSI